MMRFRRYLSRPWQQALGLLLVLLTTLLNGSPAAMAARNAAPTTFSDTQISQIRKVRTQLEIAQSRLGELKGYIEAEDWTYTSNFIHGPLGALRQQAATANRNLLPKDQKEGRQKAKALTQHIESLDLAAKQDNAKAAKREYAQVVDGLEAYLSFIPQFEPEFAAPEPKAAVLQPTAPVQPAPVQPAPIQQAIDSARETVEAVGETVEAAANALVDAVEVQGDRRESLDAARETVGGAVSD